MDKENNLPKGKYLFATTNENYEDYSSGRVLYGAPGATNFPVRFSSELFQRCQEYLEKKGKTDPYTIWDPFCGAGYSVTVLGFLHNANIRTIFASDADKTIIETTKKNLSLLHTEGLNKRTEEIKTLINSYGKNSHKDALGSANRLKQKIDEAMVTKCFLLNTLSDTLLDFIKDIDIIITDLPYGHLTQWIDVNKGDDPIKIFLDKIKPSLDKKAIVVIISDKKQKITCDGYNKLKTFTLGKRKVWFLEPSVTTD